MSVSNQPRVGETSQLHRDEVRRVWRVKGLPSSFGRTELAAALRSHPDLQPPKPTLAECHSDDNDGVTIRTLAAAHDHGQVATVSFRHSPLRGLGSRSQRRLDLSDHPENTRVTIDDKFDGITVLHSPPPDLHSLDILAVSGLGSHAFGSFVNKDDGHMWLVDSLAIDMPKARIMIFDNESPVHGSTNIAELTHYGGLLKSALFRILQQAFPRRIILIGHSLGGLVIKEALVQISKSGSTSLMMNHVIGCIFFGVPNDGMNGKWLIPMVRDGPNRLLIESLRPESSDTLRTLNKFFLSLSRKAKLDNYCFYETMKSPTPRKVNERWKMDGPSKIFVTQSSATCCLQHEADDHDYAVFKSHSDLVKFTFNDEVYKRDVLPILKKMHNNASNSAFSKGWVGAPSPSCDFHLGLTILIVKTTPENVRECLWKMQVKNPLDILSSIKRQKGPRLDSTCDWILARHEYCAWKAGQGPQLLCVSGSPGIGKTTIAMFLVETFKDKSSHEDTFAYFFCDDKEQDRKTPNAILRSLIWQLLRERHELYECIQEACGDPKPEYLIDRIFDDFDALWRIFETMLQRERSGDIFILIDAMDECEQSTRAGLLEFIQNLFERAKRGRFKFFITHRPEIYDIEMSLGRVGTRFRINPADIRGNLSKYIDIKVDKLANDKKYEVQITEKVKATLKGEAGGTFLWVSYMIAHLRRREVKMENVGDVLKNLPCGLDEAYAAIFDGVHPKNIPAVGFVLRCMVAVRYPLSKIEMQAAYATTRLVKGQDFADVELYGDILSDCSVIFNTDILGAEDDAKLVFFHQSVKDFLLSDAPKTSAWYRFTEDKANLEVLKACWTLLNVQDTRLNRGSLLRYSSIYWKYHAIASYPALLDGHKFAVAVSETPSRRDDLLRQAAYIGHVAIVQTLMQNGAEVESRDEYGRTPLSFAAEGGSEAVVESLLKMDKIDVDSEDNFSNTPLMWAAAFGHSAIATKLIAGGAKPNRRDVGGRTPLSWAAASGNKLVIESLLATQEADVNSRDSHNDTPLHFAVRARDEIGKRKKRGLRDYQRQLQLLEYQNRQRLGMARELMTPVNPERLEMGLQMDEVIQTLIDNGADLGARNDRGEGPLDPSTGSLTRILSRARRAQGSGGDS